MPDGAFVLAFVGVTFLFAGWVKGFTAVGLPTIAMGLLSIVMAPAQAAALLVLPAIATNVWQMLAGPSLAALAKRLATALIGIVAGTFATVGLLTASSPRAATAALGAVLAAYGAFALFAPRFRIRRASEKWLSPLIGLITGGLLGATGVMAVPALPYYSSLERDEEELVQTIGISVTVSSVALGLALALGGHYPGGLAAGSALALLPALGGMYVGQHIRRRLRPEVFRRWFFGGLIALGGYMLLRSLP